MYEFLGRRRVQTPVLAFRLRRHIAELLGRPVLVGTSHDHLRGDVEGQVRSTTTNSVSLSHAYALRIFLCIPWYSELQSRHTTEKVHLEQRTLSTVCEAHVLVHEVELLSSTICRRGSNRNC